MANRLYIVPVQIVDSGGDLQRHPKYFFPLHTWSGVDYGFQPFFLLGANLVDDSAIVANSDVFAFPFDLDASLTGGQATNARDAFELALIPAQWVNGGMTWRQIARTISGMFHFMGKFYEILGDNTVVIDDSTKLNVQFGSLPENIRQAITDAATELGFNIVIQNNTQLRQVLKDLSDQFQGTSFTFLNGTFVL